MGIRPETRFSGKSPTGSPRRWTDAARPRGSAATNSPSSATESARATRRSRSDEEIQAIFATPFDVSPLGVRLTCACGFALFPSTAVEPDELVRLADAALYRAKAGGPGGAAVFEARAGAHRRRAAGTPCENDRSSRD